MEARHPGDLDARRELELVTGDRRPDHHADESRLDAVRGERGLEHAARLLDEALIDLLRRAASEEVQRRQLPRSPARRGAERDLELLDDLGLGFGLVFVDRDVELVRGVGLDFLVVLVGRGDVLVVFGLDVVDQGDRLVDGDLADVDDLVARRLRAKPLTRERRHRSDHPTRRSVHRPHAVGRAHRDGTQRRAREDQQAGDTEADEDERRARGREHALQREGDDRAEIPTRVSELIERRAPVGGPERQLQETGRRDREERERDREPQSLDGRAAPDERDADNAEGDRHGEAHPADEQPDALAERLADDSRPLGVDAEAGDEGNEQAGEPGEISLVPVDRLPPPGPPRCGRARAL